MGYMPSERAWIAEARRRRSEITLRDTRAIPGETVFREARAPRSVRLGFHLDTQLETDDALDYYEGRRAGFGVSLLDALQSTMDLLLKYPLAGFNVVDADI